MKETFRFIKHNVIVYSIFVLINSIFMTLLLVLISSFSTSFFKQEAIYTTYEGKKIYQLIDTLFEQEDMDEFREHNGIENLLQYYSELKKECTFVSIYTQPVYVQDAKNSQSIDFDTGNGYALKTIEMSQETFDFYHLRIESGNEIPWKDIKIDDTTIPVYLGSTYKKYYSIGDEISCDYYMKPVTLQIVGFLEKNSFVYYQNQVEHYLDDTIVIPFPYYLETSNKLRQEAFILSMFHGQIVSQLEAEELLSQLNRIGNITNFTSFTLLGNSSLQNQISQMSSILTSNMHLLGIVIILISVLFFIIEASIVSFLNKQRRTKNHLYDLLGMNHTSEKGFFILFTICCTTVLSTFLLRTIEVSTFSFMIMDLLWLIVLHVVLE
ncbi:MAG: hypothetical protein Q4C49_09495 [Bacillota bacterium]|nr:hypothetical protein [Bacillota bacterium]